MKKNKILLIWYGWTIVMVVKDKVVIPADNIEEIFDLVPRIKEHADITLNILSNIDSTNIIPKDWTLIAEYIAKNRDNFDWFLVAHWTNTMAYTAWAVSLALWKWFWKPVIFTWSQLPLTVYGNDGMFNLENSIKVINEAIEQNISETMIVFSDYILRASRSIKVSDREFRAFDSPAMPHLWQVLSTWVVFNQIEIFKKDENIKFELKPLFTSGIITIDLSPWQSPFLIKSILNNRDCNGLILKSHGAWSVPSIWEYSFLPLIKEATLEYKVPVLVSTKFVWWCASKDVNDEPAIEATNAGAIPTWDLTDVMSEVKLMWLLAQWINKVEDIKNEIVKDYVWEVSLGL